jgi:hypothetical protein
LLGKPLPKVPVSFVLPLAGASALNAASAGATIELTVGADDVENTGNPADHSAGYAQPVVIEARGDRQVYPGDRFGPRVPERLGADPAASVPARSPAARCPTRRRPQLFVWNIRLSVG